jgi:hypothetical protein
VLTDEVAGQILAATVTPPPEPLRAAGLTHWSSRPAGGPAGPGQGHQGQPRLDHGAVA